MGQSRQSLDVHQNGYTPWYSATLTAARMAEVAEQLGPEAGVLVEGTSRITLTPDATGESGVVGERAWKPLAPSRGHGDGQVG